MHLTAGPTAVYHTHHYHHHHLSPQTNTSDWNFSGLIGKGASSSGGGGGSLTTTNSTLDPPGNSSPPGSTTTTTSTSTSTSASSQPDLWWTERLISEAQQEFPGELGLCEFELISILVSG